jgi:Icc-related predicted phosphoesterase
LNCSTHHAPSQRSVPIEHQNDILSAAYASSLDALVENSGAALWIHGHLHQAQDYAIGQTRVICNPRGYPDESDTGFFDSLTIEI